MKLSTGRRSALINSAFSAFQVTTEDEGVETTVRLHLGQHRVRFRLPLAWNRNRLTRCLALVRSALRDNGYNLDETWEVENLT